jgi:hypothetical protein
MIDGAARVVHYFPEPWEGLIVKTVKQLSLFLENKPGTLANVCRALGKANISIFALSVSDGVDHAVVRMVVDDPDKALHLLGDHGVLVLDREVLMLDAKNRPGELASIARSLADHKINIEYAYTATPPGADKGVLILRVDQMTKAARVLRGR